MSMTITTTGGTIVNERTNTLQDESPLALYRRVIEAQEPLYPSLTAPEAFRPENVIRPYKEMLQRMQRGVDLAYTERGKEIPEWSSRFFMPLEFWLRMLIADKEYEALEAKYPEGFQVIDNWLIEYLNAVSAIGTWRYTQGVYRFEPEFLKALSESKLEGDIPCEVLLRLPQWCVYVEMPVVFDGVRGFGFWAHIVNQVHSTTEPILSLLINGISANGERVFRHFTMVLTGGHLVDLIRETLEASLTAALSDSEKKYYGSKVGWLLNLAHDKAVREAEYQRKADEVRPLLAVLLYLCSTEPDIISTRAPGESPKNNLGRTKKGKFHLFPVAGPHVWRVGSSFEKELKNHYRVLHQEEVRAKTDKRQVRSHVRSAHWHGYWKSHRPKEGQKDLREFIFHWIPPLIVRGSKSESIGYSTFRVGNDSEPIAQPQRII